MGVNYRPLWIELAKREMTKTDLQKKCDLTSNVLASMGKNQYISMKNLEKICKNLELTPNEVVEFKN